MTARARTLQVFADLLASERPDNREHAEAAIRDYLAPIGGRPGKRLALDELGEGVAGLDASSAFMPLLLDALDRQRADLAEAAV